MWSKGPVDTGGLAHTTRLAIVCAGALYLYTYQYIPRKQWVFSYREREREREKEGEDSVCSLDAVKLGAALDLVTVTLAGCTSATVTSGWSRNSSSNQFIIL